MMLISDQEMDALYELPHIAQLTYFRAIRPYMDYATGIVGRKRGISRQSISEQLSVAHAQGRKVPTITPKIVRDALDLLEQAGLIQRIPADRTLVFFLPHAQTDDSVSNKEGRRRADVGPTQQGQRGAEPSSCIAEGNGEQITESGPSEKDQVFKKEGLPPISVIRREKTNPPLPPDGDNSPAEPAGVRAFNAARFEEFWRAYPNKTGRKPCQQKWALRQLDRIADVILADVEARKTRDDRWRRGYIPNPLTYLNQDRWTDNITAPAATATNNHAYNHLNSLLAEISGGGSQAPVIEGEIVPRRTANAKF
jgi:hypothetical protein